MASTGILYFTSHDLWKSCLALFETLWQHFSPHQMSIESLLEIFFLILNIFSSFLTSFAFVMLFVSTISGLVITRFNWSWKKLEPKFDKLNIFEGIKKMFSWETIPELIKTIFKFMTLSAIGYLVIIQYLKESVMDIARSPQDILAMSGQTLLYLMLYVSIGGFIIGGMDMAWQWYRQEEKLKMTKQQVKEEYKKQEGDPLVKSQRRRMAREFVMAKAIKDVPKATFIVTNPDHYAIAIKYQKGMGAPVILAKGVDFMALQIKEIAKKNDIAIVENKPLARTLYKTIKIGEEIPPSLYGAIIEVMKFIYQTRGQAYFEKRQAA
jgi:flagellar biosynthetic protein FlhB